MTKQAELAPGVVRLTDGLGLVPERTAGGAPMCIWCETRVWGACKSRYDTLTCAHRVIVPTPEEWAFTEANSVGKR